MTDTGPGLDTLPAGQGQARGARWYRRVPHEAWADTGRVLAIYAASRLLQLLAVAWLSGSSGPSVKGRLLIWDATWFLRVATEGYPHGYTYDSDGQMVGNGLAFFPGYPLLIRAVHVLGTDAGTAAIGISWAAGGATAVLLFLLGCDLAGWVRGGPAPRRVGYALVVLFCTQPMSVVLGMGYSEALFCALVAGTLLAAYRRRWLIAGALGCAASLTRSMGLAVALALCVAAAAELLPSWRGGLQTGEVSPRRTPSWRPVFGSAFALAGVPAYLIWVGVRVGHADAWFAIQTAGWGTTADWGRSTVDFVLTTLRAGTGWIAVSVVLLLALSTVMVILAVRMGTWPPLVVYGLLAFALVVGQAGYYHSKPRLLVPVLLTLVPGAFGAARVRTSTAVMALSAYAAFGLWYGAYMITVWPYTI